MEVEARVAVAVTPRRGPSLATRSDQRRSETTRKPSSLLPSGSPQRGLAKTCTRVRWGATMPEILVDRRRLTTEVILGAGWLALPPLVRVMPTLALLE